jgi:hypothetical protein
MAHNHGKEYQIRIIREDGIEELSHWLNSTEQVAQVMLAVQRPQAKAYWLLVRNILCPGCSDTEPLMEFPLSHVPSPRYLPHDSSYLRIVQSRNRSSSGSALSRYAR